MNVSGLGGAVLRQANSLTKTWKTLYLKWEVTETKKSSKKTKAETTSAAVCEQATHRPDPHHEQTEPQAATRASTGAYAMAGPAPPGKEAATCPPGDVTCSVEGKLLKF